MLQTVSTGANDLSNGAVQASNGINEIVKQVGNQVDVTKSSENIQKMQDMQNLINKDLKLLKSIYQQLLF